MRRRIFAGGILFSALAMTASAAMITKGTFNVDGEIYVTGLVTGANVVIPGVGTCLVGEACIFWQDNSLPPNNDKLDITAAGLPNGDIPAAIAGTDAANVANLFNPPAVVGASFPPEFFMSFNNAGITTQLLINFIAAGIDGSAGCSASPAAAGQVCTPPGSLFNLQNLSATSSTAGWSLSGITNDSTLTRWTGTFTSQFNTMSFQQVLGDLATNGFVQNSFSGSITLTQVPEPGPITAVGMGLMLILCSVGLRRGLRSR